MKTVIRLLVFIAFMAWTAVNIVYLFSEPAEGAPFTVVPNLLALLSCCAEYLAFGALDRMDLTFDHIEEGRP